MISRGGRGGGRSARHIARRASARLPRLTGFAISRGGEGRTGMSRHPICSRRAPHEPRTADMTEDPARRPPTPSPRRRLPELLPAPSTRNPSGALVAVTSVCGSRAGQDSVQCTRDLPIGNSVSRRRAHRAAADAVYRRRRRTRLARRASAARGGAHVGGAGDRPALAQSAAEYRNLAPHGHSRQSYTTPSISERCQTPHRPSRFVLRPRPAR
jgi:hypothetical protein